MERTMPQPAGPYIAPSYLAQLNELQLQIIESYVTGKISRDDICRTFEITPNNFEFLISSAPAIAYITNKMLDVKQRINLTAATLLLERISDPAYAATIPTPVLASLFTATMPKETTAQDLASLIASEAEKIAEEYGLEAEQAKRLIAFGARSRQRQLA